MNVSPEKELFKFDVRGVCLFVVITQRLGKKKNMPQIIDD